MNYQNLNLTFLVTKYNALTYLRGIEYMSLTCAKKKDILPSIHKPIVKYEKNHQNLDNKIIVHASFKMYV
jgi:hypothetical protein